MTERTETPAEQLARIRQGFSKNDALVIMAFADAGIDPDQIDPRGNVLTFNAWKAAGRSVARGATGLAVQTWIPGTGKKTDKPAPTEDGKPARAGGMIPKTVRLFHISQTLPIGTAKNSLKPAAWSNPVLVKPEAGYTAEDGLPVDGAPVTVTVTDSEPEPVDHIAIPSAEPVSDDTDDFGKHGDDRPATCSCPMVGVMTNVDCPLHGDLVETVTAGRLF